MKKSSVMVRLVSVITAFLLLSCVLSACTGKDKGDGTSSSSSQTNTSSTQGTDPSNVATSSETVDFSQNDASSKNEERSVPASSSSSKPAVSSSSKPTSSTSSQAPKPKTPQELILGKWEGTSDISSVLEEMGIAVSGPQNIKSTLEFISSGTLVYIIDSESYKAVTKPLAKQACEEEIANSQLTVDEFEQQIGMTLDEYIDVMLDSISLQYVYKYKFQGDDLYIQWDDTSDFVKSEYRFEGENKLIIIEDDGVTTTTYNRV